MSTTEPPEDPAEERLLALLAVLQTAPAAVSLGLTSAVMRRVRWQQTVRRLLAFAGNVTGAVLESVAIVVGGRDRSGRR